MQEVVVEPAFGDRLGGLDGQVILRQPDGRVLGFFSPLPDRPHVDSLQLEPLLSKDETEELRKVQTGKSLDEILVRLGIQ